MKRKMLWWLALVLAFATSIGILYVVGMAQKGADVPDEQQHVCGRSGWATHPQNCK